MRMLFFFGVGSKTIKTAGRKTARLIFLLYLLVSLLLGRCEDSIVIGVLVWISLVPTFHCSFLLGGESPVKESRMLVVGVVESPVGVPNCTNGC